MTELDFTSYVSLEPFSLPSSEKRELLTQIMTKLTGHHRNNCAEYHNYLNIIGFDETRIQSLHEVPFLPVRVFKEFELLSVARESVFKVMTSSGTSGQQASKIFLDRHTGALQTKILSKLMRDVIGKSRRPMLIVDSPAVLKDRNAFSARGAGILGFSMFGKGQTYALDESMELSLERVAEFFDVNRGEPVFIFGFTFMLWKYFILELLSKGMRFELNNAVLVHGGGWKKLESVAVDDTRFKDVVRQTLGVERVINYYGMVEQTGSLFFECELGRLHAPIFSDVIIRRARDFSVADIDEEGLIEVMSMIPTSYPGHALLTEDLGALLGEDDCLCGRLGKYFKVVGRAPAAEIRGCSDTHAAA